MRTLQQQIYHKRLLQFCQALLLLSMFFSADSAYAAMTLGTLATHVSQSFGALAKLITAGAYIAGLGFTIGAIMKFKQHKDNPTQIPIGTPVAMLFIAAALLFLPTILSITSGTLFGTEGGTVVGPYGTIWLGK